MAQVPYNPIETVAPTETPTPRPQVSPIGAAFGEPVAQGLTNLGHSLSQAGDEIFNRAIALQQVTNQTEAHEADSKYMINASAIHDKYNQLEGKDKVNALPKYTQDLQEERVNIRNNISNPAAQKMFDTSSLSTMAHNIMKGATGAADAHRQWTAATTNAQIDLDTKVISDNPNDENVFNDKLKRIQSAAGSISAQQGAEQGSDQEKDIVTKATSKAWQQRIVGLSRTAPFEAAKMLDDNKGNLTGDDYLRADSIVRTQGRAVGAANIANSVFDPDKSLTEMQAAAQDEAKKLNKDDPLLAQHSVAALNTKYQQYQYVSKQDQLVAKQDVADIIQKGGPSNTQEFLAMPGAHEKFEQLSKVEQNNLPGQISRYHEAQGKYDNDLNFTKLHGMALSDDSDAREEFLNTDATKENLSQPQIQRIQSLQAKMRNNTAGDPRVNKAITYLRGTMGTQLESLGVYKRGEDNKEDYDHYIGSLQSALEVWNENNKRPATYDDITKVIGPQLLKERTQSTLFGLSSKSTPFFKQEVPEEFSTQVRAITKNSNLPDDQIYKLWVRMQYRSLYSKQIAKNQDRVTNE